MTLTRPIVLVQDPDWERWVRWCNVDQPQYLVNSIVDSLRSLYRASEFDRPVIALHHATKTHEAAGYVAIYPGAFGVIENWRCASQQGHESSGRIVDENEDALEVEVEIMAKVLGELTRAAKEQGAELVQVITLIDPERLIDLLPSQKFVTVDRRERVIGASGLSAIATLAQMQLDLDTSSIATKLDRASSAFNETSSLRFLPWSSLSKQTALQLVEQTYIGTLDAPELNGLRSTARTLEGYANQINAIEHASWAIQQNASLIGCLMLTKLAISRDHQPWELTYVGLVPNARRKGYARPALQFALEYVKEKNENTTNRRIMLLAVDVRNKPAIHLYQSMGFVPIQFVQAWVG